MFNIDIMFSSFLTINVERLRCESINTNKKTLPRPSSQFWNKDNDCVKASIHGKDGTRTAANQFKSKNGIVFFYLVIHSELSRIQVHLHLETISYLKHRKN